MRIVVGFKICLNQSQIYEQHWVELIINQTNNISMQTFKGQYHSFRQIYKPIRRKLFEALGSSKYSRPGLNDLDRKLEKYLDFDNGFFIEVGGNDGFTQSNTYYLEKFRDWRGILVEGIPELHYKCSCERKKSKVFNYALVATDFQETYVTMNYANLMSFIQGALKTDDAETSHIQKWIVNQKKNLKREELNQCTSLI